MGKRLTENLSSLYIGAANSLKPKRARRKIVAYVESDDDISFWRSILAPSLPVPTSINSNAIAC